MRQPARDRLKFIEAEADARRASLDGAVDCFNVPALVAIAGGFDHPMTGHLFDALATDYLN
jgi:hypothetical protein